jgi:hypothetical protein
MSQYVRNTLRNNNSLTKAATNKTTIILASAQQAPLIADSDLERKDTESIIVDNFNGGVSFSLEETFNVSVLKNDTKTSETCLVSIVEQLSIFGTCDTRVDINSTKLTESSRKTFYKLCAYNIDLVTKTIKNVYLSGRSPKVSHSIYLLSLLTSATSKDVGSEQLMVQYRFKGYNLVSMFRITTHLFEWINTHINLCSLHAKGLEDKTVENAPGLVLRPHKKSNPKKVNKLARAGGTGAGFRRAVKSWYLAKCYSPENAKTLAIQIVKYFNRHEFTHNDVISLVHIKMTSEEKCKCKTKLNCNCSFPKSYELKNVIPVANQIPIAYAIGGLKQATKILLNGVERLTHNGGDPAFDNDIYHALNVFAFLCAVEEAKNDATSTQRVCDLIRLYRLTREMISNTKLNDLSVLFNLTVKLSYNKSDLISVQSNILKTHLPLHTIIDAHFPLVENENDTNLENPISIGMPITALIRNLNNLTSSGLLDVVTNPRANSLIHALTQHLTNYDILHKGFVHPINLFNAWAVYSQGKGHLGSKTWTPVESINKSLLEAVELSFQGLAGLDMSVAFLMDASGSMSCTGSAPGMPCLKALDIAVLLVLTFYRATSNFASMYGKPMPNHIIGYFGGSSISTRGYDKRTVNKHITDTEISTRAEPFKDVSLKFSPKMTFQDAKVALGNGNHLGVTDLGSAFWCLIGKLKTSLENIKSKNPMYDGLNVFQLPGYAELMLLITDNDVNSGDQPMDVLKLYWDLVSQAFQLLPFDKDGSRSDPVQLFSKYVPRLVVIATQGTQVTVGDPRDSRILNISGFDSSAPALIDAFVKKDVKNTSQNNDVDAVEADD